MIFVPGLPTVIGTPNAGAGATVTIPTHRAGDLIVIFAYRDGSNTAPSLPTGYTNIATGGANTNSSRAGYKIALSSGETSGTWTNATHCVAYVIRQFDNINPIGNSLRSSGASTTVTYGAVSPLKDQDGKSLMIGFAGHRSVDTNLQTAPTGMTNNVNFVNATSEVSGHSGYSADWPSTNVAVAGTSSGWETIVIEIRDPKFVAPVLNGGARAPVGNAGILGINSGMG